MNAIRSSVGLAEGVKLTLPPGGELRMKIFLEILGVRLERRDAEPRIREWKVGPTQLTTLALCETQCKLVIRRHRAALGR